MSKHKIQKNNTKIKSSKANINTRENDELEKAYNKLREVAQDKLQEKQTRRQSFKEYSKLRSLQDTPNPKSVRNFLVKYLDDIDLVREALQPEKYTGNPWAEEIWRLLDLDNTDLRKELAQVLEERAFAVEATKMQIRHKIQGSLIIHVSSTNEGPDFDSISPDSIGDEILVLIGKENAEFHIEGGFPFAAPGEYKISLDFGYGEALIIPVKLEIDIDDIPDDFKESWNSADFLALSHENKIQVMIQDFLKQGTLTGDENQQQAANLLKTAHKMGYWKTFDTQRLFQKWRAEEHAKKVSEEKVSIPDSVIPLYGEGLLSDEIEKLKVLDLPPLVAYDLRNAIVDMDVLQRLFVLPQFRDFKGKKIEDLTDEDILSLSPAGNWSVNDLNPRRDERRRQRLVPVDSRALAKIFLSIARLQFDRLAIGTNEADIRYGLSGYCTRMGEYLVQQHGRFDFARDYFQEAISLNFVARKQTDFPTLLLFRSFPNDDKRVPSPSTRGPGDFLKLLDEAAFQETEIAQTATRSFLELGAHHFQFASRWFDECSQKTKQRVLKLARAQLGLGSLADFSDCVRVFRQELGRFQSLLRQMKGCNSVNGIAQLHKQFNEQMKDLDYLLSPTNREIIGVIAQAAESVERFLQSKNYDGQRNSADTAINSLEKILNYGADNYTALWAEHLGSIAQQWRDLVNKEITTIAKNIAPFLEVSLAEERICLTNEHQGNVQPRFIFTIKNIGSGKATSINISFTTPDKKTYAIQQSIPLLNPKESIDDYIELKPETGTSDLNLNYKVYFYDPDMQYVEFESKQALQVLPLINTPQLDLLAKNNPFRTDHEVDDELMFVGRDHILEEVKTYSIDQPRGSLLMLHGQRRVGKSSLLLFLERETDKIGLSKQVLGVRISWLDYTAHSASDLMNEIAIAIQTKHKQQYQQGFSIPERKEFRESYSLAFNDVLRNLQLSEKNRLVLMWDEFDGLVNHLDAPEKGYDRLFFEYLRGLSKRKDITLILTGGELMPILFEHWGEVFNHDRSWRIAYLSPTDGSVEQLIRNVYIKDKLTFSDEAIEFIKKYSACNPFFVQMICKELVVAAQSQKSPYICKLDVEEVIKWLVQKGLDAKYVRHLYTPKLKTDPLDMVVIGALCEEEINQKGLQYVSQQSILRRIIKKDEDEVINRIGELVRREILQRNPDNNLEFRMMLPLFRDWFNDNRPEYQLWAPLLRR